MKGTAASTTQPDLPSSAVESTRRTSRKRSESVLTEDSSSTSPRPEKKAPQLTDKRAIRREQCRANQARYRNKQLNLRRQLQQQNQRLEEEIHGLKIKQRSITFERRTTQSPWTIVGEVFRLLESGFRSPWRLASSVEMLKHDETRQTLELLQKSFAHDVAMGDLRGLNALMDQWRCYALYFGDPHLELKRVEAVTSGVVSASARFRVTITDFTIRCVFPHLVQANARKGKALSLSKRLIGQCLDCSCSMTFLFNSTNGRVVRLEPQIGLAPPLLRLLGNTRDLSVVLDRALLTSDGVIGDLPK